MFCRLLVEAAITIITKVPIKNLIFYRNILAKALSLYIRGNTSDRRLIPVANTFLKKVEY